MKRLDKCCCCSLRTGTLVLAGISLVFSVAVLASLTGLLQVNNLGLVYPLAIVFMVGAGFELACDVALIAGALYDKPSLMLPYIVLGVIELVLLVPLFFWFIAVAIQTGFHPVFGGGIVGFLLGWALGAYFLHVIVSHYLNVKDKSGNGTGNQV